MTPGPKPPHSGEDPADAWERVQREASAAVTGIDPDVAKLGDTADALRDSGHSSSEEAPGNEILELVSASIAAAPERADLWMMRFEMQKTLGLREDFSSALVEAWNHPRLGQAIDWVQVSQMWDVLAPGEPAPRGIKLPAAAPLAPAIPTATLKGDEVQPGGEVPQRRFADKAMKLAARELAVLGKAYAALRSRPDFMEHFTGKVGGLIRRPTPLHFAGQITRTWGGHARMFFKREDLRKVTPEAEYALAQAWVGLQLGRKELITGNDVDGHSLGLAIAAQRFGQKLTVAVRRPELEEKKDFIERLRKLGVTIESNTEAVRDTMDSRQRALHLWQQSGGTAHLALSLGWGPGPYPSMVNDFQSLIGREVAAQVKANSGGDAPRTLVASVGSEVDAIGFVLPFLNDDDVELVFAEPEPGGPQAWRLSRRLKHYNGARREHLWLQATGRVTHIAISDAQALAMQQQVGKLENIQLSFEDARSVALASLLWRRSSSAHNYIALAG